MTGNTTGDFREISQEMCETVKEITARENDALIKRRKDGTYDVFELERTKRKPRTRKETE